jgi:cytochrome c-type biogenesis protein CcmH
VKFVPYIGFALVALAAAAFVLVPLWKAAESRKAKALLGGAVALFVLGIGVGVYWAVGEPRLALRDALGTESGDIGALTPLLIERVRQNPNDQQAWLYLARIYLTASDARQAAGALGHAIEAGRKSGGQESPDLHTAHGELLVQASGGQITPAAMEAFNTALRLDPANAPARYYLGMAAAQKKDNATAAKYWQSLLADVPANSPLRSELVDRLASIGAAPQRVLGKDGAPDPTAMVAGLAERLKKDPNDPAGWLRLIRAYHVLGEFDKAKEALATARKTVGADATVKAALDEQAKELKLE